MFGIEVAAKHARMLVCTSFVQVVYVINILYKQNKCYKPFNLLIMITIPAWNAKQCSITTVGGNASTIASAFIKVYYITYTHFFNVKLQKGES